jgi:hypothetical protein
MLTEKDNKDILSKINSSLSSDDRVLIKNASDSIVSAIKGMENDINGVVMYLNKHDDIGDAALLRNNRKKVLFVFSEGFAPTLYFTSVSKPLFFTKALEKRALADS